MAVSKRLRFEVMRRDGHRCRYCGRGADEVKLTIDHVVAEALGGEDKPENLVTACADCNSGKSATPADAALVAAVSDDAVRWARARNLAAEQMLADLERREELREQFRTRWNAWGWPDGDAHRRLPLPSDWQVSVDSMLASGLPIEVLIDCINLAMQQANRRRGPAHDDVFRYMCGIAWNKVRELQEATRAHLGAPATSRVGDELDDADIYEHLREHFSAEELEWATRDVQKWVEDTPTTEPGLSRSAVLWAVDTALYGRNRLVHSIQVLLRQMPADQAEALEREARTHVEGSEATLPAPDSTVFSQVVLRMAGERATAWLNERPADEAQEWLAGAAAFQPNARPHMVAIQAAENARNYLNEGRILHGMCPAAGEHGATCPRRSAYKVSFSNCDICESTECAGHVAWCQEHMEKVVDGELQPRNELVNYEPYDPWDF